MSYPQTQYSLDNTKLNVNSLFFCETPLSSKTQAFLFVANSDGEPADFTNITKLLEYTVIF